MRPSRGRSTARCTRCRKPRCACWPGGERAGLAGLSARIDADTDTDLDGFPAVFLAFRVTDAAGAVVARGGQAPDVDADPALAAHAAAARARGIELAYAGPDSLVVPARAHALDSVLDNFVGNAVRHGRADGAVEVTLSRGAGGAVRLAVRDDGPGIPMAERERVFGRFCRGDGATAPGSGLGLAIVASAASRPGADLSVTDGLDGRGVSVGLVWETG